MKTRYTGTTLFAAAALLCSGTFLPAQQSPAEERITVDASAKTTPFPHFWEQTFGSGRAILSLRESYRRDLKQVKDATNFDSIRFHGILMDEVGLYDPDRMTKNPGLEAQKANDASIYNFSYIDQIYDGLLDRGVRPYVELSFMPRKLAADPSITQPFFYRPFVSPPSDYAKWDAMITALGQHLIERYGLDEVSHWNFEVWNEPNLDFWGGDPKQATYWTLYDHTARALKAASPRLRVGGPATAQAAWVPDFIKHVHDSHVPVDFVSTHVYANDLAKDVFGTNEDIPRSTMVYRAVKKVHDQIAASSMPTLPLYFSEYGASYANESNVSDSPYMGPWLANTIRQCDGLIQNMAYWSFSDVFEEQGVVRTPFYGGFGIIAADNIPKPSFNAFTLLHKLGTQRIALKSESALASTDGNGAVTIALWNYAVPGGEGTTYTKPQGPAGPDRSFDFQLEHVAKDATVQVWRVDPTHGNSLAAFDTMGRPSGSLTREQIRTLQQAAALPAPESMTLQNGHLKLTVPAYGLAVITLQKQ
ncbi:beta-xylosidase [Terriglobus aquaticus]